MVHNWLSGSVISRLAYRPGLPLEDPELLQRKSCVRITAGSYHKTNRQSTKPLFLSTFSMPTPAVCVVRKVDREGRARYDVGIEGIAGIEGIVGNEGFEACKDNGEEPDLIAYKSCGCKLPTSLAKDG